MIVFQYSRYRRGSKVVTMNMLVVLLSVCGCLFVSSSLCSPTTSKQHVSSPPSKVSSNLNDSHKNSSASASSKPPDQKHSKKSRLHERNCTNTHDEQLTTRDIKPGETDLVANVSCTAETSRSLEDTSLVEDVDHEKRRGKNLGRVDFSNLFREESDNYPEDQVRLLLKQTPDELKDFFNVLNTPLDPNMNLTERMAHHYGDEDDQGGTKEESVCRSVMRNIYPREVNRGNSLVYVPNNQEFMQVIQAEICQHPDQECSFLRDNLPYGMLSTCRQKYAYKKLLYLDPLEQRMASDMFRFPSCCSCYVSSSTIDLRSNAAVNSSNPENHAKQVESSLVSTETNSNSQTTNSTRPKRKDAPHTVVLNEDKVYTPNN